MFTWGIVNGYISFFQLLFECLQTSPFTYDLNVIEILWKTTFVEMDSVALGLAAIHGSTNYETQACWCDLVSSVTISHQSTLDFQIQKFATN